MRSLLNGPGQYLKYCWFLTIILTILWIYIDAGIIYVGAGRNTSDSTSHPGTLMGTRISISSSE